MLSINIQIYIKYIFYCVNTCYPMENCFTGQRDRSCKMTEKVILYIVLAGPVMECAFARWRIILPSCLDIFHFAHGVCRRVFL